jgi:hypothetical protein
VNLHDDVRCLALALVHVQGEVAVLLAADALTCRQTEQPLCGHFPHVCLSRACLGKWGGGGVLKWHRRKTNALTAVGLLLDKHAEFPWHVWVHRVPVVDVVPAPGHIRV